MGLETGTYVSDLVVTNPPSNDQIAQGDDHIRLLKAVLKNTFPQASKAIYFPTSSNKTANFSVLITDQYTTFTVDPTAGAVTVTLPTLASGDAGWECSFVKVGTSLNPYFIAPPSGTIQSGDLAALAKTRRSIPGARTRVLWTGSNWFADRVLGVPVGTVLDFDGAALPIGYEWPNGQTLASASTNYPDYNSRKGSGVTVDLRGRSATGKDDMGGSAANRVTSAISGIAGNTLDAAGGDERLHQHTHSGSTDTVGDHTHNVDVGTQNSGVNPATVTGGSTAVIGTRTVATSPAGAHSHVVTITNAGSGSSQNMPPTAIMNKILVVE